MKKIIAKILAIIFTISIVGFYAYVIFIEPVMTFGWRGLLVPIAIFATLALLLVIITFILDNLS